jgi:hypothetical protein
VTGAEKKKAVEAKSRGFTPVQMRIDRKAMYEMVCRQVSHHPHLKPAHLVGGWAAAQSTAYAAW